MLMEGHQGALTWAAKLNARMAFGSTLVEMLSGVKQMSRGDNAVESAYLLWYVREWVEGEGTELFIGVYRTEADAHEAVSRLKDKPGFVKYPEGFLVEPYELGKDHWTEGFVRMLGDEDITDLSGEESKRPRS